MANKAAQATSFSLMLVRYYKIMVLMTSSVRSITPSPLSSVVISEATPLPPLDDDVICGCPHVLCCGTAEFLLTYKIHVLNYRRKNVHLMAQAHVLSIYSLKQNVVQTHLLTDPII